MGQGLRREKHLNVHEQEACSLLIRWRETESVFSTTQYVSPTLQGIKRETYSAPAV